jgi:hypothetical protein
LLAEKAHAGSPKTKITTRKIDNFIRRGLETNMSSSRRKLARASLHSSKNFSGADAASSLMLHGL